MRYDSMSDLERDSFLAAAAGFACGIAAGPLFLTLVVAQASLREEFDPSRHSVSLLSLGPWGWIQIGSFIGCGLMTLAASLAIRRLFGDLTFGPLFIVLGGLAILAMGLFPADPVSGFPPSQDQPSSDSASLHGKLNTMAGFVAVPAIAVAFLAVASSFAKIGRPNIARGCRVCGVLGIVLGPGATRVALASPLAWLPWLISWGWLVVVCWVGMSILLTKRSALRTRA